MFVYILGLYNDYAVIHTMYIFFFLCDAAIYLLNCILF